MFKLHPELVNSAPNKDLGGQLERKGQQVIWHVWNFSYAYENVDENFSYMAFWNKNISLRQSIK